MKLRARISLILLSIFILYTILNYCVQHFVIMPGFIELERDGAKKDIDRCSDAIKREIHHLDVFTFDWSGWDDTGNFIEKKDENYETANLSFPTFKNANVNLMYFFDIKGNMIWGKVFDYEKDREIHLKSFPASSLPSAHPLLNHKIPLHSINGILITELGPMLIVSRPITNSKNELPIKGTLIMGRFLNNELITNLNIQTRIKFRTWPQRNDTIPEVKKNIIEKLTHTGKFTIPDILSPYHIEEINNETLIIYTTFYDITGKKPLLIEAEIPREITKKGKDTIYFSILSLMLIGLVVIVTILKSLEYTFINPVSILTEHIIEIRKTNDLSTKVFIKRNDEIGVLAKEFNRMMEKLSEASMKLMEYSYHSGMSKIASEVLHNIRNSINPIVSNISFLTQELNKFPLEHIKLATSELSEGTLEQERRQDLVDYLKLVQETTDDRIKNMRSKLDEMRAQFIHIEGILAEQDNFSQVRKTVEKVKLEEMINSSVAMAKEDKNMPLIECDKILPNLSYVMANKFSLLHIFLSIIIYSSEAIKKSETNSGLIKISAVEYEEDKKLVFIKICQNGKGLDEEEIKHIFERGKIKIDKRKGFELHWCANSITAMSGKIYVTSDGKEKGTCFNILLPKIPVLPKKK